MSKPHTIKIIIADGMLAAVENLPDGWLYEVEDHDIARIEEPATHAPPRRRLYAVHYDFREGDCERRETLYFRATPVQLERHIRLALRELSVQKARITWRLERQWASADDPYAYELTRAVKVTAEVVDAPAIEIVDL